MQVKRGLADNELNRYRYDIIIHDVFTGGAILHAPMHERQEPAFVARDQMIPRPRIPLADLLNEQAVILGRHIPSLSKRPRKNDNYPDHWLG